MNLKANIGFINLETLENFFPEELIDYKEIERIDKEEKRKRRMLERAEQSVERGYRELQYILLAEYQDKKLERQDTDTSLVHNSIIEENNNQNDNNDNDSNFIFSNNLRLLPKVKQKENMRYNTNKKENYDNEKQMKATARNFNVNTLSAPKLKKRNESNIYINARNIQKDNNMTMSKIKNNFGQKNNMNVISNRARAIKPMNLRQKLVINAKNKNK
jgi:hypothetical protein